MEESKCCKDPGFNILWWDFKRAVTVCRRSDQNTEQKCRLNEQTEKPLITWGAAGQRVQKQEKQNPKRETKASISLGCNCWRQVGKRHSWGSLQNVMEYLQSLNLLCKSQKLTVFLTEIWPCSKHLCDNFFRSK